MRDAKGRYGRNIYTVKSGLIVLNNRQEAFQTQVENK